MESRNSNECRAPRLKRWWRVEQWLDITLAGFSFRWRTLRIFTAKLCTAVAVFDHWEGCVCMNLVSGKPFASFAEEALALEL